MDDQIKALEDQIRPFIDNPDRPVIEPDTPLVNITVRDLINFVTMSAGATSRLDSTTDNERQGQTETGGSGTTQDSARRAADDTVTISIIKEGLGGQDAATVKVLKGPKDAGAEVAGPVKEQGDTPWKFAVEGNSTNYTIRIRATTDETIEPTAPQN